jgi:hypothetical protein
MVAGALFITACQDSVNPSLEESVAPYLELEAIEGASNTNVTVNRGDAHGLDSYFAFDLSNIESNGLIREGVVEGWCLEWNKPIRQNNDVHQGVELYNTYGSSTWKSANYLMTIKKELKANDPDLTYREIQVALWSLIDTPTFNLDEVLQEGRMPSRMISNGQPNFSVKKTKEIVNRVRKEVGNFEYKPGSPIIVFSRTEDDQQNIGGVTTTKVTVSGDTFVPEEYFGWLFNRDKNTQSPYVFTADEASIGSGSLYVEPITNSINGNADKFIGELFLNKGIANIDSLSYDFLIGPNGDASDENEFYLNVYANFGESSFSKYYDCKYDVVPSTGSTSDWTTVTFDPTQSYQVTTRSGISASPYTCPSVPADMDNDSPGSTIHFVAINVGDTSGNDQDLDGYYDNFVVTLQSGTTVYDFE